MIYDSLFINVDDKGGRWSTSLDASFAQCFAFLAKKLTWTPLLGNSSVLSAAAVAIAFPPSPINVLIISVPKRWHCIWLQKQPAFQIWYKKTPGCGPSGNESERGCPDRDPLSTASCWRSFDDMRQKRKKWKIQVGGWTVTGKNKWNQVEINANIFGKKVTADGIWWKYK